MKIEKCAVLGAGQMGGGIIQVFATSGFETDVWVRSEASEERAVNKMEKYFSKLVEKGRMTEDEATPEIPKTSADEFYLSSDRDTEKDGAHYLYNIEYSGRV